jgi:hypothetical protein
MSKMFGDGIKDSRRRKARSLPTGSGFNVPLPKDLLASPAWATLCRQDLRLLTALMIEHAEHGGEENGRLKCPYDTLQKRGMRRADIKNSIHRVKALGFADVDFGKRSHGAQRLPSTFRLTWLGTPDGLMPTNEWKAIKTEGEALTRLGNALSELERQRAIKAAERATRTNNRGAQAA